MRKCSDLTVRSCPRPTDTGGPRTKVSRCTVSNVSDPYSFDRDPDSVF